MLRSAFKHAVPRIQPSRKMSLVRTLKSRKDNIFALLMTGVVASELMWIIRMRNEKERLEINTKTQLQLMDKVIEKLKKGENVDVEEELIAPTAQPAESLDEILKDIEAADAKWREQEVKLELPQSRAEPPREPKKQTFL